MCANYNKIFIIVTARVRVRGRRLMIKNQTDERVKDGKASVHPFKVYIDHHERILEMKVIYTFGIDEKPVDIEFKDFVSWLRRLSKNLGDAYNLVIDVKIGSEK